MIFLKEAGELVGEVEGREELELVGEGGRQEAKHLIVDYFDVVKKVRIIPNECL